MRVFLHTTWYILHTFFGYQGYESWKNCKPSCRGHDMRRYLLVTMVCGTCVLEARQYGFYSIAIQKFLGNNILWTLLLNPSYLEEKNPYCICVARRPFFSGREKMCTGMHKFIRVYVVVIPIPFYNIETVFFTGLFSDRTLTNRTLGQTV